MEFYRRLPPTGEPELIHNLVPAGAAILDLGCGPGRIAGPLVALGHEVTGVDESELMIDALPPGVTGVVGDARTVRLGRSFDAVLLASHLVNTPDDGPRFVRTAAAHLAPDGLAIAETYPQGWDPVAAVGRETRIGDVTIELVRARVEDEILDAEVVYAVDGEEWRQPFVARLLGESSLAQVLAEGGLEFLRWLEKPGWFAGKLTPQTR